MNKTIRDLDLEKVLFFDIETVRQVQDFDENHPNYDTWAWKCRNTENNIIPPTEEVIAAYNNKAALSAEWGKIVCISVGFIKADKVHVKSLTGDEKEILEEFVSIVKKTGYKLAAHNIPFDLPYIRKRYFINGLTDFLTENQGMDIGLKPWDMDKYTVDTMGLWKGISWANTSLDELCMVFNIPTPKDNMHGNEVGEYYYSGRIKEIADYCNKDVVAVANILRVWQGKSLLEVEIKQDVAIKDLPLLEQIKNTKEIDKKQYAKLIKGLTQEEVKVANEIISAIVGKEKINLVLSQI